MCGERSRYHRWLFTAERWHKNPHRARAHTQSCTRPRDDARANVAGAHYTGRSLTGGGDTDAFSREKKRREKTERAWLLLCLLWVAPAENERLRVLQTRGKVEAAL